MFQVVVLPPPDALRDFEEFRRVHDPAFHRIGAHVPLLPPFDADDATLYPRFDAFDAGAAIDVEFGPPVVSGRAVCIEVTRGSEPLRSLQASLAASLLGPLDGPPRIPPALRAGLLGGDAELELARRSLATLARPAPWRVAEITLLLEDVRGLWHRVRTRPLA